MANQNREELRQLWISRLADLGESKMTQEEWCAAQGIPYSRLRYWVTKLRKESITEGQAANWLQMGYAPGNEITAIAAPETPAQGSCISIRFSGFAVKIQRGCPNE